MSEDKNNKLINVYIPADDYNNLKRLADKDCLKITTLCSQILRKYSRENTEKTYFNKDFIYMKILKNLEFEISKDDSKISLYQDAILKKEMPYIRSEYIRNKIFDNCNQEKIPQFNENEVDMINPKKLFGGYIYTTETNKYIRRSPVSISALLPYEKDSLDIIEDKNIIRVKGKFVFTIAIDKKRLFSLKKYSEFENEISEKMINDLLDHGWYTDDYYITAPFDLQEKLTKRLINEIIDFGNESLSEGKIKTIAETLAINVDFDPKEVLKDFEINKSENFYEKIFKFF